MLQVSNRDRDVIEDAETLPVVRERVVEAPADVDRDPALERKLRREDAPARAEERGVVVCFEPLAPSDASAEP